jgi:hypothetical protein
MTGDSCIFKSIDTSQNGSFDAITFSNNKRGKVKGLGKIAISNDMSISNVLLVESLDFNFVISVSNAYLVVMMLKLLVLMVRT